MPAVDPAVAADGDGREVGRPVVHHLHPGDVRVGEVVGDDVPHLHRGDRQAGGEQDQPGDPQRAALGAVGVREAADAGATPVLAARVPHHTAHRHPAGHGGTDLLTAEL